MVHSRRPARPRPSRNGGRRAARSPRRAVAQAARVLEELGSDNSEISRPSAPPPLQLGESDTTRPAGAGATSRSRNRRHRHHGVESDAPTVALGGRTVRLPRCSGHDRAGSLKSGVSRLPGTAPAMRPPDRLGGRAARGPLPSGTPSTRIRGAGLRTRGPRIRPGGAAPPPGGP